MKYYYRIVTVKKKTIQSCKDNKSSKNKSSKEKIIN